MITLTRLTSPEDRYCFRCQTLGIPDKTILKGSLCVRISRSDKTSYTCLDCLNRLIEELDASNDETK